MKIGRAAVIQPRKVGVGVARGKTVTVAETETVIGQMKMGPAAVIETRKVGLEAPTGKNATVAETETVIGHQEDIERGKADTGREMSRRIRS